MFEHPDRHPHEPAGHAIKAQRQRGSRGHVADRDPPDGPKPHRRPQHPGDEQPVQQILPHRHFSHEPQEALQPRPVAAHGGADIDFLGIALTEQFDRLDIGIGVHDPPGDEASGIRPFLARRTHTLRDEQGVPDEPDDPEHQRNGEDRVHLAHDKRRRDHVCGREPERLERHEHTVLDRRAELHHPVRQPPCEVVLEKAHGLTEQMLVRPPAHLILHVGHQHVLEEQRVEADHERTEQQDEQRGEREFPSMRGPEPGLPGVEQVHDPARIGDDRGFGDRDEHPGQRHEGQDATKVTELRLDIGPIVAGRRVFAERGEGVHEVLEKTKHDGDSWSENGPAMSEICWKRCEWAAHSPTGSGR